MNLLCKLFGHQPPVYARKGWWSPGEEYGHIVEGPVDGTGTIHGLVKATCARCQYHFVVARVHIPRAYEEKTPVVATHAVKATPGSPLQPTPLRPEATPGADGG